MSPAAELGKGVAGHEKGDGRYVLSRHPDVIMFSGFPITSERPKFKGDVELFSTLEFRRSYELMRYTMEFKPNESSPPKGYEIYFYRRVGGEGR